MPIRTAVYVVSRYELAMITAWEYVRTFWWFIVVTPIFGILALIFGSGLVQVVGMFALLWPFSIPARAIITSSRSSRLFSHGCHLEVSEDGLTFFGEPYGGKKPLRFRITLPEIRNLGTFRDCLVVRTKRLGFAPIKFTAFASPEQIEELERLVSDDTDAE